MKSFVTKLAVAPLLLLAAGAVLSACSSTPEPSPLTSYATDVSNLDPATAAYLEENARTLASQMGIVDPPEVAPIRLIELNEWANVQTQCLNEAGFEATISSDGAGVTYPRIDESLTDSLNLAIYQCEMKYPTQLKYMTPLSEKGLTELYEYRTGPLLDCMRERGVSPSSDAPSLTVFLENGGVWSPFEGVELTDQESGDLNKACPQTPDSVYGE